MSDDLKDLLALAATACGWTYHPAGELDKLTDKGGWIDPATGAVYWEDMWAPHLDDGDGARMETKLHLSPEWGEYYVAAVRVGDPQMYSSEKYADHNGDEQAARRWASLRAAAQIGKGMT